MDDDGIEIPSPQQMAVETSIEQLGLPMPLRYAPDGTAERLAQLQQVGIAIDLGQVFLDTFISMVMTEEGEQALIERYQGNVAQVLAIAEENITRARLLQGL